MAKNNKNTVFISVISLVLAIIIIAGCGSFRPGSDKPAVSTAFLATGTEGIVMRFLPDQPPAKVYTQAPLTFLVEVWNRGTHRVDNADFYLTGYDMQLLPMQDVRTLSEPLEGKSQYNPDGGFTTLTFESMNEVVLSPSMPNYRPTFLLTACYPYQTVATPLVCIDPNPQDTISDKACYVQKSYGEGSQGAPVAVQNIEAEANPTYTYFRIHVANVGGSAEAGTGLPYDIRSLNKCPASLTYSDLNTLEYEVAISGQPLDCEPSNGKIRLVNNKAMIFCKYRYTQGGGAYQTPLEVRLIYGYKNSVAKMVDIENLEFAR